MNNSEKNRLERERIKTQKELYKANKLIIDQKEKEKKEIELKAAIEESKKNKIDKVHNLVNSKDKLFLNISLEKLYDTSVTDDVLLTDMLGIKDNDFNNIESIDQNDKEIEKNTEDKINELDIHYAPDFI